MFENYVELIQVDDQAVELSLWDTAGQEEFDRLRALSYADTHCILLCFAVDSPVSLENAGTRVGLRRDRADGSGWTRYQRTARVSRLS